jgi:hypothetical protein
VEKGEDNDVNVGVFAEVGKRITGGLLDLPEVSNL